MALGLVVAQIVLFAAAVQKGGGLEAWLRTSDLLPPLTGALVVVVADLLARRLFAPIELPVGVLTAVVGAPYLMWLIVRTRSRSGGTTS